MYIPIKKSRSICLSQIIQHLLVNPILSYAMQNFRVSTRVELFKQLVPCLIHPPKIPAIHKIAVEEETILFLALALFKA